MSAQEFKVGQQVKDGDYDRLPVGAKAGTLEKWSEHEWRDLSGIPLFQKPHATRVLVHLPAAEPEDKDDLYVEPEPLKAGDWALAWVRIEAPKPDKDGDVSVSVPLATVSEIESGVYFRADAIVRPDAGQVPPWITAEQDEAKAISAIKTALVVDGGMHDDRYTQQTAESLYRAGIRATKGGAS